MALKGRRLLLTQTVLTRSLLNQLLKSFDQGIITNSKGPDGR